MSKREEWEEIRPVGKGGQSEVFLVRSPARVAERQKCVEKLKVLSGRGLDNNTARDFAQAAWNYARPELLSELGALKIFNPRTAGPEAEQQALDRLRSEIAVLKQNRPGLLRLLDSSEEERWIVTEYYPNGTLENHPFQFKGNASLTLTVFRSLVETVAALHDDKIVHRDIKPANVFFGNESRLVLGDFGIVFLPGQSDRVTVTNERVGPRDYVPPWADIGERLEKVQPNFDVYMLGKLLWCMMAGRMRLPREWHRRREYDLTQFFNTDPHMHMVNEILDKCVVENPEICLPSAVELLKIVDEKLTVIGRGGQLLGDGVPRPCHVCGLGLYQPEVLRQDHAVGLIRFWFSGASATDVASLGVRPFICSNCGHIEFFRTS